MPVCRSPRWLLMSQIGVASLTLASGCSPDASDNATKQNADVVNPGDTVYGGKSRSLPPGEFPSELTTGVDPSAPRTRFDGVLEVREPGEIVENLDVVGSIYIADTAIGAVLRNFTVTWPTDAAPGAGVPPDSFIISNGAPDVLIEDCLLTGNAFVQTGILVTSGRVEVRRCDISGVGDGITIGEGVVDSNFIHDISDGVNHDWHADAIQVNGGQHLIVSGNTVLNTQPETSAVGLWAELGDIDDMLVTGNLLGGGGYTVYTVQRPGYSMTNVRIIGNTFTTALFPEVGFFGLWYPSDQPADLFRKGNTMLETGAPADR